MEEFNKIIGVIANGTVANWRFGFIILEDLEIWKLTFSAIWTFHTPKVNMPMENLLAKLKANPKISQYASVSLRHSFPEQSSFDVRRRVRNNEL